MELVVWRPGKLEDGVCSLRGISGVPDTFELSEGMSRAAGWPPDACAEMSPSRPRDIALADSLFGAGALVVSARLRDFLESIEVNHVEFLPVRIVNHKGRTASADYFVANPLDVCDCIDQAQSGVEYNAIDPDSIFACKALVLDEARVPASHEILRPEHWRSVVLIRRTAAEAMLAAGLTGLRFIDPPAFTGLF